MGNGARQPSLKPSAKIARSLIGKRIVNVCFSGQWLHLDLEGGIIVRINATEWVPINRTKYGGPFLVITKNRQKGKTKTK